MRFLLFCLLAATVASGGCGTKKVEETTEKKPTTGDKAGSKGLPSEDVAALPPLKEIIHDYVDNPDLAENKYPGKWFQFAVIGAKAGQLQGGTVGITSNYDMEGNYHLDCIMDNKSTKMLMEAARMPENFIVVGKFSVMQGPIPLFAECRIIRMMTPDEVTKARAWQKKD